MFEAERGLMQRFRVDRQEASSPLDPPRPDIILVYRDPCLKRITYHFDISRKRVTWPTPRW